MAQVHEHRGAFAPVGDALRDLRDAEATLREEQHEVWQRYVARVDEILSTDLKAEETEAMRPLFDSLRTRLDDLRVQAKLGAMEGEDLVTEVRATVGHLRDRLAR